jgi:hypothetical protein
MNYDYNKAEEILKEITSYGDEINILKAKIFKIQHNYDIMATSIIPIIKNHIYKMAIALKEKREIIKSIFKHSGYTDSVTKMPFHNARLNIYHYYYKISVPFDDDEPEELHVIDINTISNFLYDYNQYMMYFCYSVMLSLSDDSTEILKIKKEKSNYDYKMDLFNINVIFENYSDIETYSQFMTIIPKHISREINYEEVVTNFIIFLKKIILEINLLKV